MRFPILLAYGAMAATAFPIAIASAQSKPLRLNLAKPGISAWEVVKGGRIRLVAAPVAPTGEASAAIEIELEPGFKTYWRNPGKDGIPPDIRLSGSPNVVETRMSLPPPRVYREVNVSVGYEGKTRFPIAVRVRDPGTTYRLTATGVVGFCADICVPVPFRFETEAPRGATARTAAFSAPDGLVEASEELKLLEARFDPATSSLSVDAIVPDTDVLLDLVVDPVKDLDLPPAASKVHQKGDRATFTFELPEDTRLGPDQKLAFTLVVGRFQQPGRIGIEQALGVKVVE